MCARRRRERDCHVPRLWEEQDEGTQKCHISASKLHRLKCGAARRDWPGFTIKPKSDRRQPSSATLQDAQEMRRRQKNGRMLQTYPRRRQHATAHEAVSGWSPATACPSRRGLGLKVTAPIGLAACCPGSWMPEAHWVTAGALLTKKRRRGAAPWCARRAAAARKGGASCIAREATALRLCGRRIPPGPPEGMLGPLPCRRPQRAAAGATWLTAGPWCAVWGGAAEPGSNITPLRDSAWLDSRPRAVPEAAAARRNTAERGRDAAGGARRAGRGRDTVIGVQSLRLHGPFGRRWGFAIAVLKGG